MSDADDIVEPQSTSPVVEALQFERVGTLLDAFGFNVEGKDVTSVSTTKPYARFRLSLGLVAVLVKLAWFPTYVF